VTLLAGYPWQLKYTPEGVSRPGFGRGAALYQIRFEGCYVSSSAEAAK